MPTKYLRWYSDITPGFYPSITFFQQHKENTMFDEEQIDETTYHEGLAEFLDNQQKELLVGGIEIPEGWQHVQSISSLSDGERINVQNLLPNPVIITNESTGISLSLDRGLLDDQVGFLLGRVIHDLQGTAHIFRYDDIENKTTHFLVRLGLH